jgi:hypothetical protein
MGLEPRNILVRTSFHPEGTKRNPEGKIKYELASLINWQNAKADFKPLSYEIFIKDTQLGGQGNNHFDCIDYSVQRPKLTFYSPDCV